MSSYRGLLAAWLALASLLPITWTLPAPQASDFPGWAGAAGDDESSAGAPLRGPSDLLGYTGPVGANPADDAVLPTSSYKLAPGQDADAHLGIPFTFENVDKPQPIRGDYGANDPGPQNYAYQRLNPDTLAPPASDSGDVGQIKWPMALSHNHISPGNAGWLRQQNIEQLPQATAMAGVDLYLSPNAYRELHWHKANEWTYIIKGSIRVQTIDSNGQTFIDDLEAGDVWYFPRGLPHSLQAFENGTEMLLVFDQGDFSASNSGLASEMFLRTPKEVLSKNLNAPLSAFNDMPKDQLYIFDGTPPPKNISEQNITGPGGVATGKSAYSYHFSKQEAYETPGGSIKILDPETFPVASNFSAALVTIKPGAMREIHWHSDSDEWGFFLSGRGRMSVYEFPSSGGTFDFSAGDVGYVPIGSSHYIENTGDEDIVFLEILQAPKFTDISVAQWLRLTPKQIVKDTLKLPDNVIDGLSEDKQYVIQGNTNLTALAGGNGTA